jgi:hypothetical protein
LTSSLQRHIPKKERQVKKRAENAARPEHARVLNKNRNGHAVLLEYRFILRYTKVKQ